MVQSMFSHCKPWLLNARVYPRSYFSAFLSSDSKNENYMNGMNSRSMWMLSIYPLHCDRTPIMSLLKHFTGFTSQVVLAMIAGLFLAYGSPAEATNYYVDQGHAQALDSNPGTEALPWKTLYRATQASLAPGDTVYVKTGVYDVSAGGTWTTPAINPPAGAPGSPVTFQALPRHGAVLDLKGSTSAIGSGGRSYVVIDGFVVTNADSKGIVVFGASAANPVRGVIIQNNIVNSVWRPDGDNTDGIRLEFTYGVIVRNNRIYNVNNGLDSHNASGLKLYENEGALIENNEIYNTHAGIHEKKSGKNNTFRLNYIHNARVGILLQSGSGYPISGHKIYQNIVSKCSQGIGMLSANGDPVTDIAIYNNIIANYTDSGIYTSRTGVDNIWNNIFYRTGSTSRGDLFTYEDPAISVGLMDYNLFAREPAFYIGVYQTNRIYGSLASWRSATQHDLSSRVGDPLFENAGADNYKLSTGSPALGSGRLGGIGTSTAVNMGPYITGSEVVGIRPDSDAPAGPFLKPILK